VNVNEVDVVRKRTWMLVTILLIAASIPASAADVKDMIGTWKWRDFTVEVRECQSANICAKIVSGPRNLGMEMFASRLVAKGGELFGEITDPQIRRKSTTRDFSRRTRIAGSSTAARPQKYA
jgi:hypothetical protein